MGKFGWSYPPGCSGPPDQDEGPCEVCGLSVDDCICPVCPACQGQGDPACYQETDLGICGGLYHTGRTLEQQIGKQQYEISLTKQQLADQENHLAELEKLLACREYAKQFGVDCWACYGGGIFCCLGRYDLPCYEGCPA